MTNKEYAEHRGVKPSLITKLKKSGKITKRSYKGKDKTLRIDSEKADEDLENNLDHRQRKKKTPDEEKEETIKTAGIDPKKKHTLVEAQTLNQIYQAALKKLEFEEKKKELIRTDDIERFISKMIIASKTQLLGLKSKISPIIYDAISEPEVRETILTEIDNIVRTALQELSEYKV